MTFLIDTSSLISLVKYYLPFDGRGDLLNYFEQKIRDKEILIIDKVQEESKYLSKGVVFQKLAILKDKKIITKTIAILPDKKFFNNTENQFCYGSLKNKLSEAEFEVEKSKFLNSADAKLILYCYLQQKTNNSEEEYILITEETKSSNDNKLFKKIPAICEILGIKCIALPEYIEKYSDLDIGING